MKITPLLNPQSEFQEVMQTEASSPIELLGNEGHAFQWGLFFDSQRLGPLWDEAVKEEFPDSYPFRIPERGLYAVLVVDPEHMLKVLPPPATAVLQC